MPYDQYKSTRKKQYKVIVPKINENLNSQSLVVKSIKRHIDKNTTTN